MTWDPDLSVYTVKTPRLERVRLGPKAKGHETEGLVCFVCGEPLRAGDDISLVPMGPATFDDGRRHEAGMPLTAICAEVHTSCVGSKGD